MVTPEDLQMTIPISLFDSETAKGPEKLEMGSVAKYNWV